MPRPWLPLYPADYLADTRDLDVAEHGAYVLLLMESWERGPLPDDLNRLCRLAAGARPETVRLVLERYWTRTDAGWTNARLERERVDGEARYQAKVERMAAARDRRLQASSQDSNQASNQGQISGPKSAVQPQSQPQSHSSLREDLNTKPARARRAAVDKSTGKKQPQPGNGRWPHTDAGWVHLGESLGVPPRVGELMAAYQARVKAAKDRARAPP
jgi:uncharacterized protein YdaU (DUF1376 family)